MPLDIRTVQRKVDFLGHTVRDLEAERSELLVRSTVAEEQLAQMQEHTKALIEDYQRQIIAFRMAKQPGGGKI